MTVNATQAELAAAPDPETEVKEVLDCLRKSLSDPGFASAVVLLLTMTGEAVNCPLYQSLAEDK